MKYDVDYFIDKFTAIPDDQWTTQSYYDQGKCCALGHCGVTIISTFTSECDSEEGTYLASLIKIHLNKSIIDINDYEHVGEEKTPKARVLKALNTIKRKLEGEA